MDESPGEAGPKPGFLTLIDWFLSDQQRDESPDELRRRRILVGIPLALVSLGGPLIALLWALGTDPWSTRASLAVMFVNIGALATIRLGWNTKVTVFAICANINLIVLFTSFYRDGEATLLSSWSLVDVVAAMYLGGVRLGLGFVGGILVEVAVCRWAHQVGCVIPVNLTTNSELPVVFSGATGLMVLAIFGWLNELAHREAHETMSRALKIKEQGEANLLSLIESTTDFVYALDSDLRLVAMNSAFRNMALSTNGRPAETGESILELHEDPSGFWPDHYRRALAGERVLVEHQRTLEGKSRTLDISINPIAGGKLGCTAFVRDITARKEQEERLREANRQMAQLARQAGMAEVATGILHNVGNTLNSVNVSAGMVVERVRQTKLAGLAKVNELLLGHADHLGSFLSEDPKGRQLPKYLAAVTEHLQAEHQQNLSELDNLVKKVNHIKAIVALQQNHSKTSGVMVEVSLREIIDDAVQLQSDALRRSEIALIREGDDAMKLRTDPHKILQILVNLLVNARHAAEASGRADKRIAIRVAEMGSGKVRLTVEDNGVGIAAEHMPRMFAQGFTTKKNGHGFGLHMSALTIRSLGGALTVESAGPGQGATFALDLPLSCEAKQERELELTG